MLAARRAVSRRETGETRPNTETLKLLSKEYGVTINTLPLSPRQLFCRCCGMPLSDDGAVSREPDGSFNEDHCTRCCADGAFSYGSMDEPVDHLIAHTSDPDGRPEAERRALYTGYLSKLKRWA